MKKRADNRRESGKAQERVRQRQSKRAKRKKERRKREKYANFVEFVRFVWISSELYRPKIKKGH